MNAFFILCVLIFLCCSSYGVYLFYTRPEAKQQSRELLSAILTPEQYRQLVYWRHIDIPSPSYPGRIYRVPWMAGCVQVREAGVITMWLCLQPSISLPNADIVIIHKLMIEANEEIYLQRANHLFFRRS